MRRAVEPVEDVLARHGRVGANPVMETLLFRRLSADKRSVVESRIRIIDRYLRDRGKDSADPIAAASAIGISVRSLYRLLVRVEELGAVAALAPTRGAGRSERSDRYKGVSPVVDDVIRLMVRSDPHVQIGPVYRKVVEVDAGVHQSTVRRRLLYWRSNRDPGVGARFGRIWLLERAAVDIPVRRQDGRTTWLPVDFLIDVDTAIVCGARPAITSHDLVWDVFADAAARLRGLPKSLPVADRLEGVIWADAEPRREIVGRIEEHATALTPPVVFEARRLSRVRPESALTDVLGAEFGPFRLINAQLYADRELVESDGDIQPMEDALVDVVLAEAVALINQGALRRLDQVHGDNLTGSRTARLDRLFGTLVEVFEPVIPLGIAKAVASELDRLD